VQGGNRAVADLLGVVEQSAVQIDGDETDGRMGWGFSHECLHIESVWINPKSETRNPKEIPNPKSEEGNASATNGDE
jgi:hypothetical protein